jgi:hypothetical protein
MRIGGNYQHTTTTTTTTIEPYPLGGEANSIKQHI